MQVFVEGAGALLILVGCGVTLVNSLGLWLKVGRCPGVVLIGVRSVGRCCVVRG